MAFPHPKSRKEHYGHEDKRTINIAEYRNAEDDVNRAKDPTFGALVHDWFLHGFAIYLDSRFLSRPGRPAGRFNTELLCVLRVQPLPAAELHRLGADDASNRLTREQPL